MVRSYMTNYFFILKNPSINNYRAYSLVVGRGTPHPTDNLSINNDRAYWFSTAG